MPNDKTTQANQLKNTINGIFTLIMNGMWCLGLDDRWCFLWRHFTCFNLDISHFAVQGVPTADAVEALAPVAIASEVKDQRGVVPDFKFLIPGEGDFDYVDFIGRMARAGYDGSISVEISVLRQRLPGYDPYEAARKSYEVLSSAFEVAGVKRVKANS